MEWKSLLQQRLDVPPVTLAKQGTVSSPQLAKDEDYARSIQEAWKNEVQQRASTFVSESSPLTYKDAEGTTLYGFVVRRINSSSSTPLLPGVLLFHTAAGPHDVCLHWKADSLVADSEMFPDGCIVLVADILSDDAGWGWDSDRTRYNQDRELVMTPDKDGVCRRLQSRLEAAVTTLKTLSGIDSTRLAAMGWCLGGRVILELGRMQVSGMRAMVTFHGVFDGKSPNDDDASSNNNDANQTCQVLICNGSQDPFVSQEMLDAAVATFSHHSCKATIQSFEGARHGFTNPAQAFNPNPSFGYDKDAATKSWNAACLLLQRQLGATPTKPL